MKDVMKMILDSKIIAIMRGIPSDRIVDTVQALLDGGIRCVEVTFNPKFPEISKDTVKSIALIKNHFGDRIAVGAGTVLTLEDVNNAFDAGAEFIISPDSSEEVIGETNRLGMVSIPGAVTPTEIIRAYRLGGDIIKLFPAATLGLDYIKAITSPINHIPLTSVGGVNAKNAMDFIRAGCVGVSVGGNLVNRDLIMEGRYDEITRLALEYKLD
jgi:2-dehydro-3-deoxyphosphogluconate aldolase/(4S)-4-hydroxy-2-oxoglutarate aldolase